MEHTAEVIDRREVPAYDIVEAARYLRMPVSTLRSWFTGQPQFRAVLAPAQTAPTTLSFFNLVEAHVVNAIRRDHALPLQIVRQALDTAHQLLPDSRHPLIDQRLETDGVDLFVRAFGELVNLSMPNQLMLKEVLDLHLRRILWAADHLPSKLFPFSGLNRSDDRRTIVIDPRIGFGRRVINGTGIATRVVFERFTAGESIDALAEDYARSSAEIEDAIRSESELTAA